MPTHETVSLLGSRTTKILMQPKSEAAEFLDDHEIVSVPIKAQKRVRLQLDESQVVEMSSELYRCSHSPCKKVFKSKQNLKNHMAYHKTRTNFVCSVQSC